MADYIELTETETNLKPIIKAQKKYNRFMQLVNMSHQTSKFVLVLCGILFILGYSIMSFSEIINWILLISLFIFVVSFIILLHHTLIHLDQFK